MRIFNIDLPLNKQIGHALTFLYGIGVNRSRKICSVCEVNFYKKVFLLNFREKKKILNEINKFILEGDLRKNLHFNIKKLINIKCYRGLRHLRRLPVRGQRTRTNAKTARKGLIKI